MPIGRLTLFNRDGLEVLESLPRGCIDFVFVDLPYGKTRLNWDNPIDLPRMWKALGQSVKATGAMAFTATQPFSSELVMSNLDWFRTEWIWKKNTAGIQVSKTQPLREHESVLIYYRSPPTFNPIRRERVHSGKVVTRDRLERKSYSTNVYRLAPVESKTTYDGSSVLPRTVIEVSSVPNCKGRLHPSQKPVELMSYFIHTYSQPGELVVDFTMGSGSTGEAAIKLGRRFLGADTDPDYFQLARDRLKGLLVGTSPVAAILP